MASLCQTHPPRCHVGWEGVQFGQRGRLSPCHGAVRPQRERIRLKRKFGRRNPQQTLGWYRRPLPGRVLLKAAVAPMCFSYICECVTPAAVTHRSEELIDWASPHCDSSIPCHSNAFPLWWHMRSLWLCRAGTTRPDHEPWTCHRPLPNMSHLLRLILRPHRCTGTGKRRSASTGQATLAQAPAIGTYTHIYTYDT